MGRLRKGLLAGAGAALLAFAPVAFAGGEDDGHGDGAVLPSLKVAIEGQIAPGTHGQRFDPQPQILWLESPQSGFASPRTNNDGNVAFRASYGNNNGAGVFGWERDTDTLIPIGITGQHTKIGFLPRGLQNYDGPTTNNNNEVAFGVRHMNELELGAPTAPSEDSPLMRPAPHSAIFFWTPGCEELEVVVAQGDPAPGGGYFDEFDGLSMNDDGDIAFIASLEPSGDIGVFLKKHGHKQIQLIALNDQLCPQASAVITAPTQPVDGGGDNLAEFNLFGPWLNNKDDVLFAAECGIPVPPPVPIKPAPTMPTATTITSSTTTATVSPEITPSNGPIDDHETPPLAVYIKRPYKPLKIFFAVGDRAPGGGVIEDFYIGQRGINDESLVATLEIAGGRTPEVVATKQLDPDECDFQVCAYDGQRVIDGYFLFIRGNSPTIAQDGELVFPGNATTEDDFNTPTLKPDAPPRPSDVSAIFSCRDGDLGVVAFQGDKKPVDHFHYGELNDSSNANCWATFVDETYSPTGVFLAPTNECQDNTDNADP